MADTWKKLNTNCNISGNFGLVYDNNSCGPYYHGPSAYYFCTAVDSGHNPGETSLVGAKSQDGTTWTQVAAATMPHYSEPSQYCSFDEYNAGGVHYLYAGLVDTQSFFPSVLIQLHRLDFVTETWTYLGVSGEIIQQNAGVDVAPDSVTYAPLPSPYHIPTSGTQPFFVRVDQSNGHVVIFFVNGELFATNCIDDTGPHHYDLGSVGFSTWDGVSISAYQACNVPNTKGIINLHGAWVVGSKYYIAAMYVGTYFPGVGDQCSDRTLSPTGVIEFGEISGASVSDTLGVILVTGYVVIGSSRLVYRFNEPGCPPFTEPKFIGQQVITSQEPVVFAFNLFSGALSRPILLGGSVFFTSVSISRTVVIHKFTAPSTLLSADTGKPVSVASGSDYGIAGTYAGCSQLFVKSGSLRLMWRNPVIPSAISYTTPTVDACGGTQTFAYAPTTIEQFPDFGVATVNATTLVLSSITQFSAGNITASTGTQTNDPGIGMMPLVVPLGTGTPWNTGDEVPVVMTTSGGGSGGASMLAIQTQGSLAAPLALTCPIGGGAATVGVPYSTTLIATGGTPPYTYSIASGALPAGVTLDPSTGIISGTPITSATFSYTPQVTDALGVTFSPASPCSVSVAPAGGGGGVCVVVPTPTVASVLQGVNEPTELTGS